MSDDPRLPVADVDVSGIDERIDDALSARLIAVETLAQKLQDTSVVEPRYAAPERAYDGQLEFCDGTYWDPIGTGHQGYVYWYNGEWHKILDQKFQDDALSLFALAAYGGLHYDGAAYSFPDIGVGWEDIDFLETPTIAAPRGITVDTVNSRLAVENAGVYALMISLSFGHNSVSSNGRITSVRLYNYTDGVPLGDGFQVGTGRTSLITTVSLSVLVDVLPNATNDAIGMQIGMDFGGSNYTNVEFYAADFSLNSVGEFRGTLPSRLDPDPPAAPQTLMTPGGDTLTDPDGNILLGE